MAVLTGKDGSVKIGPNTVLEIDSFSLEFGTDLEETQAFGDSWKERTANLADWSGTFEGRFDNTDTNGHIALQNAALNGTTVSLRLYVDGTHYYSGSAYIRPTLNVRVGETIKVSYAFTGSGALTYN